MIKDQDQLEFAISQYLDGTLSEFDRRVLEVPQVFAQVDGGETAVQSR